MDSWLEAKNKSVRGVSPGLCSKGNLQWGALRRGPRAQRPRASSDYSRRNIWPEEISEPQAAAHLGSNNVPYWWPPVHCEQLARRVHTVQKGRDFLLQILGCFPGVMGWCWSNNFYQAVESKSSVRNCSKLPPSLGPPPSYGLDEIGGWGAIPTLESLGLSVTKAGLVEASCAFVRNFTSSNFVQYCFLLSAVWEGNAFQRRRECSSRKSPWVLLEEGSAESLQGDQEWHVRSRLLHKILSLACFWQSFATLHLRRGKEFMIDCRDR